jgi:hypothetical protein
MRHVSSRSCCGQWTGKELRLRACKSCQALWRENLKGFYRTSADPLQQAEAFRTNRMAVYAYAKSVGFKSSRASKAAAMALLRRYRLISHLLR